MTAQPNTVTPVHMVDQEGKGFWVLRYDDGYYYMSEDDNMLTFNTEEEARSYLPEGMYHEATSTARTETT